MRRIGEAPARAFVAALTLFVSFAAAASEVEFYQTVDRAEVGTEDTFRLTVVMSNAPSDAELKLPPLQDFEVLSKSPSTQTSIQVTGAGTQIQRITRYVLVLRPTRTGTLTIAPSTLTGGGDTWKTDAIQVEVKKGRLADPRAQAQRERARDPFRDLFGPDYPGMDPFQQMPDMDIPTSDSDLFVRTHVDDREVYIGEQVTMSVYVFSRVDLSSVDSVTLPKLEGFWAEDIDSPTQLSGEQKIINGVPYRAYLLKRKALFPTKAGKLSIDPVEADITTGYLFAGHRVHRRGNEVTVTVRPLPPGAPPKFSANNVGRWRLNVEATPTEVKLGDPVTVKVVLEGRGNVKNVAAPKLEAPPSFKVYDPTTSDRASQRGGGLGGRRTQEYLVMPTQTGTFTLPALEFPYFNPESKTYEVARSESISLQVTPGGGGAAVAQQGGGAQPEETAPKNVLSAEGGLQPVRHTSDFEVPGAPVWKRPWFLPAALSPFGIWIALGAIGLARTRMGKEDLVASRKKQAREARKRLSAAEKLKASGTPAAFYAEVERAMTAFLDARLGEPVTGLTRDALALKLAERGVPEADRAKVISVLETCEFGQFAPGGADAQARDRLLDEAEAAMEALEAR